MGINPKIGITGLPRSGKSAVLDKVVKMIEEEGSGSVGIPVIAGMRSEAIFYHFVSGLRHLVMDFGYWETLRDARMSALATFILTGLFFFSFLYLAW